MRDIDRLLKAKLEVCANGFKYDDAGSVTLDFPECRWSAAILVHGMKWNPEEGKECALAIAEELAKRWNVVYTDGLSTEMEIGMKQTTEQPAVTHAGAELAQLLLLKKQAKKELKKLRRAIKEARGV